MRSSSANKKRTPGDVRNKDTLGEAAEAKLRRELELEDERRGRPAPSHAEARPTDG